MGIDGIELISASFDRLYAVYQSIADELGFMTTGGSFPKFEEKKNRPDKFLAVFQDSWTN